MAIVKLILRSCILGWVFATVFIFVVQPLWLYTIDLARQDQTAPVTIVIVTVVAAFASLMVTIFMTISALYEIVARFEVERS